MTRYLVIGNGVAGTTAAENIRKHDGSGDIIILSAEQLPFYYRIMLNEYIAGEMKQEDLIAKKSEWYRERKIVLKTGVWAQDISLARRVVVTNENEEIAYDKMLIATGSKSFVPPVQGIEKKGVFTLRTVDDARQIVMFAEHIDPVVMIGGGLLGLEAGNALVKRGKKVTVVEAFPRLLPRQLDTRGAERLAQIMVGMGFEFCLGAKIKEIAGKETVESVMLAGGERLAADMVIVSAGVRPDLDFARKLGLVCKKGIVVDDHLETSSPGVFAAGDVAEYRGMMYGIWPAAMEQGKIAGSIMAGADMSYHGTVMASKLKVVGIDLASAGEIDVENRFSSEIEETDTVYKKIVMDKNRPIGCIMLGDTSQFARIVKDIGTEM